MIEYCEVIKIFVLITILVLHLMCYCKSLRFSVCFFLLSFGNPVKECCRRCLETVFCLNTFIVGFTLFFLFDFSFFRESPACALTFVVYENVIHFLLPNR